VPRRTPISAESGEAGYLSINSLARRETRILHCQPQGRAQVKTLLPSRPGNTLPWEERENRAINSFSFSSASGPGYGIHRLSLGKNGADPDGDIGCVLRCEAVAGQE